MNDETALTPTLESEINLISASGWEFVRMETITVQKKRWFFLRKTISEEVMVFRRRTQQPLKAEKTRQSPAAGATRVMPRRVNTAVGRRSKVADIVTERRRRKPMPMVAVPDGAVG
ncbi:MAG: hypothetical protein WBA91_01125 [Paracoccaceae bacterium]